MEKQKKSMLIAIVAILTLLVIVGGATYAYFTAQMGGGNTSPVTVTTNTTDSLTFIEGTAINLYVETADFGQGAGNKTGTTTTKANLIANNYTNSATANYNVFFIIDGNTFEYTTDDQKAELIMSVTDPEGNAVTSINGLEYVTSGGVNGFDITARANNQNLTGSFLIASDYEISASLADGATGPAQTEQSWTVTVTLVNLDTDQNANTGKTISARLVITKDGETTYEIAQINSATTTTTATSATVTLDNITVGSYSLEKYFFGVEEVTSTTAFRQTTNNILRLGNNLLAAEEDAAWYESSTPTYTFTNLKDDTSYIFYAYGVDSNGIKTQTYATSEVKTLVYTLAQVSATATSDKTSITITASGTTGSGTIEKYYYTVDYKTDGTTEWLPAEGTTNTTYTAKDLISNTAYNVAVMAVDSNGRETNPYTLTISTLPDTFASYIIAQYTSDGQNGLYLHDADLANGANDGSYRYAGADYALTEKGSSYSSIYNDLIKYYCDPNAAMTDNWSTCWDSSFNVLDHYYYLAYDENKTQYTLQQALETAEKDGYVEVYVNNYVCFGSDATTCPEDNLYRIIGVFENQVKLIKSDFATSDVLGSTSESGIYTVSRFGNYKGALAEIPRHYWSGSSSNAVNAWSTSTFNTSALNTNYLSSLGEWGEKIAPINWYVAGGDNTQLFSAPASTAYSYELGANSIKSGQYTSTDGNSYDAVVNAKIGLMYVSEYGYAASPDNWTTNLSAYNGSNVIANNWMYSGVYEWTISRRSSDSNYAYILDGSGIVNCYVVNSGYVARPTFTLEASVSYASGIGTRNNPYRIEI